MVIKKFNLLELAKKIHVGVDVTFMYTNFGGCDFFGFGDFSPFNLLPCGRECNVISFMYFTK